MHWTAPELLRCADPPLQGTKKGDIYSFGIVFKEVVDRTSPYQDYEDVYTAKRTYIPTFLVDACNDASREDLKLNKMPIT